VAELQVTPAALDVRDGAATVTVSATITDENAVSLASFSLRSPTGAYSYGAGLQRTSGDRFTGSLTLGQGTASGRWRLDSLALTDAANNTVTLNRFDLADLGFEDLGVDVTGRDTADAAPPRLSSLQLAPGSVDVRGGSATVTVSATITDESGVPDSPAYFTLRSPSGAQSLVGSLARTGGDEFTGSLELPQGAATGRWQPDHVLLTDVLGNPAHLYRFDLADLGFEDLGVDVTGRDMADTAPPRVSALRLTPASVDVSGGPATVTVSATITDESGVPDWPGFFTLRSPSGEHSVTASLSRTSGDEFTGSLHLPQGSATGRWQVSYLTLDDAVRNNVYLGRFDLADLGFDDLGVEVTTVEVTGQGRFGTDGDGQVTFSLSNDEVRLERIRGQRFTFAGQVDSISGAAKAVTLRGVGTWNGASGYTFEVSIVDKAPWGRLEDTIDVVIRDPGGVTVLASGTQVLKQGNIAVTPPASG
jgi:hypothetical protein